MPTYPPYQHPLLDRGGRVTTPWYLFFTSLARESGSSAIILDEGVPTALPAHHATHEPGGTDALTALDASTLVTGTVATARLPGYYDFIEGTPANPPADTVRHYSIDDSGFTFLEERDAAGRIIRTSRDTVAVGKVDEPGGVLRGECVYVSGASGANRLLKKALATTRTTTPAFGLAMESGVQNAFIRILTSGLMAGLDTSAVAEGTRVFLSDTTAGALTVIPPLAPSLTQRVGWVLRQHGTLGEIGVLPSTALSEAAWTATHAAMHAPGGRDPLTALDAGVLTTGTVPDARLSGNVALENTANAFTQPNTFVGQQVFYEGADNVVRLLLHDRSRPVNQRKFEIQSFDGYLVFVAKNDAETSSQFVFSYDRATLSLLTAGAIRERNRAVPLGEWSDEPFNASRFTCAPPMGWAITAGQVVQERFTLIGKTLLWMLWVAASPLVFTASNELRITLPGGLMSSANNSTVCRVHDQTTWVMAAATCLAGSSVLSVVKLDASNFALGANFYIQFTLCIQVS